LEGTLKLLASALFGVLSLDLAIDQNQGKIVALSDVAEHALNNRSLLCRAALLFI
jgi:hypothetical protein